MAKLLKPEEQSLPPYAFSCILIDPKTGEKVFDITAATDDIDKFVLTDIKKMIEQFKVNVTEFEKAYEEKVKSLEEKTPEEAVKDGLNADTSTSDVKKAGTRKRVSRSNRKPKA